MIEFFLLAVGGILVFASIGPPRSTGVRMQRFLRWSGIFLLVSGIAMLIV